jgi:hypothetical protein
MNRRQRKPKGQSSMDNPDTLATLCTQDTDRRKNTTQLGKLKRWATQTQPKSSGGPMCREG